MRIHKSSGPAALVLAVFALVLAMTGGAAVAAGKITTKQIKNGAVTSAKVKDGSLTLADFDVSERVKLVGPAGAPGLAGLSTITVESPEQTIPAGKFGTVIAYCPEGMKVTGGGYASSIAITAASMPPSGSDVASWGVIINNYDNPISVKASAFAICV